MTDKVQKIRKEVERLRNLHQMKYQQLDTNDNMCLVECGKRNLCNHLLLFIDSLQEEPVNIWHDSSKETPIQGSNILMFRKVEKDTNYPPIAGCFHGTNSRLDGRNWGYYNGFCYNEIEPPVKWAYVDDLLKLSNIQRIGKEWKEEPVNEKRCMFTKDNYTDEDRKVLCEKCKEKCEYSKKEEPVSESMNTESMIESYKQRIISQANGMKNSPFIDMCLASYKHGINETLDTLNLSNVERTVKDWKEMPVSKELEEAAKEYANSLSSKCDKTYVAVDFKAGAKWQKEHLWKPADGDELKDET